MNTRKMFARGAAGRFFDRINRIDRVRQAKRDTTGEMKGVHSDKKSTVR